MTDTARMRVMLATAGSRGDVEPFLALASALGADGHAVRIAATDDADLPVDADTVSLGVSFAELAHAVAGRTGIRAFREHIRPAMRTLLTSVVDEALAWRPEVIVAHPKLVTVPVVAETLGIPYLTVELTPVVTPTGEFPAPGVLNRSFAPAINRLSYRAAAAGKRMFATEVRETKHRLGIPGSRPLPAPAGSLVAVSPAILPRPADWPRSTHLTGDWPLASVRKRGDEATVREFLADRAPFVYAGFGSMSGGNAVGRAEAIIDGARSAGLRVLMATGWGGLEPPHRYRENDVLTVASVPHAAVLPHAVAAIHHGGAGTVHAATRAGTPSIVVPFLADQPFWARTLERIGIAGAPLARDRLRADIVRRAIADAVERRPAVERIAERMRQEDGPKAAAAVISEVVEGARPS